MAIADEIIVMNGGRIEDAGSPESIYLAPRTLFSAGFMGETNVLEGRVGAADADALEIECAIGTLRLPSRAATGGALVAGAEVGVCFRPEQLRVIDGPDGDVLRLDGARLVDQAFFGTHRRARLALADGSVVLAHLPRGLDAAAGDAIAAGVPRDAFVVLPTLSG